MKKRGIIEKSIITFFALWLVVAFNSEAVISKEKTIYEVSSANLRFMIDKDKGTFEKLKILGKDIPGKGSIYFIDGKTQTLIKEGKIRNFKRDRDTLTYTWFSIEEDIKVNYEIKSYPTYILYKITVPNSTSSQRWLKVIINFPFSHNGTWEYWDGKRVHKNPSRNLTEELKRGNFPLSCVYSSDVGIALGVEPFQYLSFLESGIKKKKSNWVFFYDTKMVIDPKEEETVEFVIFGFKPNYEWRDAVQIYYDSFPEAFSPHAGIDPRLSLNGAGYLAWHWGYSGKRGWAFKTFGRGYEFYARDLIRKFKCGWEWGYGNYVPFPRAGDWLATKEYTENWITKRTGKPWKEIYKGGVEDYKDHLRDQCETCLKLNVAPLLHWCATTCEEELAKECFPDSLYDDGSGREKRIAPWDWPYQNCLVMYPYGNSYGKKIFSDLEELVKEYPIRGIAADFGSSLDQKHFGGGVENSPGRAYEDGKIYVSQAVGIAKLFDKIHELKRDGYRMGIVKNSCGRDCHLELFRVDSAIYEHPPYYHLYGEDPMNVRLLMGRKSIIWWLGYELSTMVDWRALSPEELKKAFLGARDYVLLYSLYTGSIPAPFYISGVPKLQKYLPLMVDLALKGWEPVPAVRADKRLWLARYSRDIGSCLYIGNATTNDINTKIIVDNPYLGKMNYAFLRYGGGKTVSFIEKEHTTLEFALLSKEFVVLRTILGIEKGEGLKVETEGSFPKGKEWEIRCKIESPNNFSANLECWVPKKVVVSSLTFNDKEMFYKLLPGKIRFGVEVKKGKNLLKIKYIPEIQIIPSLQEVKNYPFVKGEERKPNCYVVTGERIPENDKINISMIKEYFYKPSLPPIQNSLPTIKEENVPKGYKGNLVIVGTPETSSFIRELNLFDEYKQAKGIITLEDNKLIVAGVDSPSLRETILLLLNVLDEKYPRWGHFSARSVRYVRQEIFKKIGLDKGVLDD